MDVRPYEVSIPDSYDGSEPIPVVVLLHWYGGSGDVVEAEYQLEPSAQQRPFLYVRADATRDSQGNRSWNATDACCHSSPAVDDAAYLNSVIDEVSAEYNVDSKRIYMFGISNGGFMAHRMACDYADKIAAIVSVVGATVLDRTQCAASEPVSILEIHGTADEQVLYDGGSLVPGHPYPGTEQTVADWAALNDCAGDRTATGERLDLESTLPGSETVVSGFEGCPAGTSVELWIVEEGTHALHITPEFVPAAIDFLFAHAKP